MPKQKYSLAEIFKVGQLLNCKIRRYMLTQTNKTASRVSLHINIKTLQDTKRENEERL